MYQQNKIAQGPQYDGSVMAAPPQEPALDQIGNGLEAAVSRLGALNAEIDVFADHTVGPVPAASNATAGKDLMPSARVDRALALVAQLHDAIDAVNAQFNRLRRI